jgi:UDP-N-acetylglucosamine--N-acetylmuramyl-(pentapeptide) pyrophosphoryl-undecaprenol N-acetylglucosamine transferase
MKILISGGHLTPALAFIDYLKKDHPTTEVVFAGRLWAQESTKQRSNEEQEITKRNIKFIPFKAAKLATYNPIELIGQIFYFIPSLVSAMVIIIKHKPNVYLSFGGYLAVPLAIASWLLRIPIITHEQTRSAGLANSLISRLAHTVALAHRSSQKWFPKNKTKITGNLIRPLLIDGSANQPTWFTNKENLPILYITGGSQGSEVINTSASHILRQLTKEWVVIHQCGAASTSRNYERELMQVARNLNKRSQSRYFVRPWIEDHELTWLYKQVRAIVSRAGANTVEEINYFRIPSILIPLPFSHQDEQLANAKALSDKGLAILLLQKDLSPDTLLNAVNELQLKHRRISAKFDRQPKIATDGAKKLYYLLKKAI